MSSSDDGGEQDQLAMGIGLGLVIGAAVGLATDNIALWIPMGLLFGVVIGSVLERDG